MNMRLHPRTFVFLLAGALVALPSAVLAQGAPGGAQQGAPGAGQQGAPGGAQQGAPGGAQQGAPGMEQQAPSADIDDEQLKEFADAFVDVRDIESEFARELEDVKDNEKAQALQEKTQGRMVEAVKENGLSVSEYNNIVTAMQQDPALQQKVMSFVEEAQK